MVNQMATHAIGQDESKIIKLEIKIEIRFNSSRLQTPTSL